MLSYVLHLKLGIQWKDPDAGGDSNEDMNI